MKFIDQWKFKLMGRAVPVVKLEDIDNEGRVYTIHFLGHGKRRANSIVTPWDQKTWEIDRSAGRISFIDEKGIDQPAFLVTEGGQTTKLYTKPITFHALEDVQGRGTTLDDITDAMDLGKSSRNLVIGILVGAGIGCFVLAPILQGMLS